MRNRPQHNGGSSNNSKVCDQQLPAQRVSLTYSHMPLRIRHVLSHSRGENAPQQVATVGTMVQTPGSGLLALTKLPSFCLLMHDHALTYGDVALSLRIPQHRWLTSSLYLLVAL